MPRYEDEDDYDDRPQRPRRRDDDEDDRPRRRSRDDDDDAAESAAPPPGNGMATASMVLGLVGFCVPVVCGVIAIILGLVGLGRAKKIGVGKGMAIVGIILGVLNGIVAPAIGGYFLYRGIVKAQQIKKELNDKFEADMKKRDEENKASAKKWEESNKEFAKQAEEDRKRMEAENKERMRKIEEERKLASEVSKARSMCIRLELVLRTYMRTNNKPPEKIEDLPQPKGGPPLEFTDPWGKPYQIDAEAVDDTGKPAARVYTLHPTTGERIQSINKPRN